MPQLQSSSPTEKKLLGTLSRRELASKTGLHPSYVSRVLKGERNISLEAAAAWAKARGFSLDEFNKLLTKAIRAAVVVLVLAGSAAADQVTAVPARPFGGGGVSANSTNVFTVAQQFASGTAAVPAFAWSGDADGSGSGIYRPFANWTAFVTNGNNVAAISDWGSLEVNGRLMFGSALNTNMDVGLQRHATGVMRVTASSSGANQDIRGLIGGGAAVASAAAMPLPTGSVFHVTGTTSITIIIAGSCRDPAGPAANSAIMT